MSEKQNNLSETFAAREEKPENAQNEEVVCGISDHEGDEKSMEETSVTEQSEISAEPHEKQDKKLGKKFVGFLSENALLIALCGVMLCLVVIVALALIFGGETYDKLAVFWLITFVVNFISAKRSKANVGTIIVMILSAVLAVGFIVLYGLSLGGII